MGHGLALSFPMQGHINPLINLCSNLVASSHLAITFVLSHHDHARLRKASSLAADPSDADLPPTASEGVGYGVAGTVRFVGVPDELGMRRNRTGGAEFRDSYDSMVNMKEGVRRLLYRMKDPSCGFCRASVTFLLADTFVDWAHLLSQEFGIPLVSVFASNAASALVFLHAPSLVHEEDEFVADENVTDIPGISKLHPRDFPICFTFGPSHYRYQFVLRHHLNFLHSSVVLINTVEELEAKALEALRQDVLVLPTGPFVRSGSPDGGLPNLDYWEAETHCLGWLDTQGASSVVYISFGSISTMSQIQIQQLALGLEAAEQPFLWVIREDSIHGYVENNLPQGFLSRTKDIGLIISWAPQMAVLSHPAVGAFMTHCGWNSAMENFSLGGLPTMCWPLVAEQRMNCKIFVDEWRTGIEVVKGRDGIVDKEEVEKAVKTLMMGSSMAMEARANASRMKERVKNAMSTAGSSMLNLKHFMDTYTHQSPCVVTLDRNS